MQKYQITLDYQIEAENQIAAITRAVSGNEQPTNVRGRELPLPRPIVAAPRSTPNH